MNCIIHNSDELDLNGLDSNIANQNYESETVSISITKSGYFKELNLHRSKFIIFNFIILKCSKVELRLVQKKNSFISFSLHDLTQIMKNMQILQLR